MKLDIRDVQYEVNIAGAGAGEPLLLIHGFSGSQRQWQPFIERWASRYRLILLDLLGHGGTSAPEQAERYSTEQTVKDIEQVLEHFGIESAHVLGYSMGGRIALSFAMLAGGKARSLILESSSPGLASEKERAARRASDDALAARIEQQSIAWFAEYWGSLPLFASLQKLPAAARQQLHEARLGNNPFGLAQSLRGIGTGQQPSWWEQLHQLTIPVQLIAGRLDSKYCEIAQAMQQRLPCAELELVSEAGHNVHMEQPQLFDTIVMRFLDQIRKV